MPVLPSPSLPSGRWQATGSLAPPTYPYKDSAFANGPCAVATLEHNKLLKVVCRAKTQPLTYSLDESSQGAMAVRFTSGNVSYCARCPFY